ncbi:MAG: hypothetical protein DRJ40_07390 [Thermoprotei archaeon]|nr:MAG: hypothetical protein DRJ40_07390 [Thermoprotei archaeon]
MDTEEKTVRRSLYTLRSSLRKELPSVMGLAICIWASSQLFLGDGIVVSVDTFEFFNMRLVKEKVLKLCDLTWNMGTLDPENIRLSLYYVITYLISMIFGPTNYVKVWYSTSILLSYVLTYMLLRHLGFSKATSAIAAVFYATSPFLLNRLAIGQVLFCIGYSLTPLTVLLADLLTEKPRRDYAIYLGLALALVSMTQLHLVVLTPLLVVLYVLVKRKNLRKVIRYVPYTAIACALPLLPWLLSLYYTITTIPGYGLVPIEELVTRWGEAEVTSLSTALLYAPFVSVSSAGALVPYFEYVLVLWLACILTIALSRIRCRIVQVGFVLYVIGIVLAFLPYLATEQYIALYRVVPALSLFRESTKFLYLSAVGLTLLIATSIDALRMVLSTRLRFRTVHSLSIKVLIAVVMMFISIVAVGSTPHFLLHSLASIEFFKLAKPPTMTHDVVSRLSGLVLDRVMWFPDSASVYPRYLPTKTFVKDIAQELSPLPLIGVWYRRGVVYLPGCLQDLVAHTYYFYELNLANFKVLNWSTVPRCLGVKYIVVDDVSGEFMANPLKFFKAIKHYWGVRKLPFVTAVPPSPKVAASRTCLVIVGDLFTLDLLQDLGVDVAEVPTAHLLGDFFQQNLTTLLGGELDHVILVLSSSTIYDILPYLTQDAIVIDLSRYCEPRKNYTVSWAALSPEIYLWLARLGYAFSSVVACEKSGCNLKVVFRVEKSGVYLLLIRALKHDRGGEIEVVIDGRVFSVSTRSSVVSLRFIPVGILYLSNGLHEVEVVNVCGLNVIDVLLFVKSDEVERINDLLRGLIERGYLSLLYVWEPELWLRSGDFVKCSRVRGLALKLRDGDTLHLEVPNLSIPYWVYALAWGDEGCALCVKSVRGTYSISLPNFPHLVFLGEHCGSNVIFSVRGGAECGMCVDYVLVLFSTKFTSLRELVKYLRSSVVGVNFRDLSLNLDRGTYVVEWKVKYYPRDIWCVVGCRECARFTGVCFTTTSLVRVTSDCTHIAFTPVVNHVVCTCAVVTSVLTLVLWVITCTRLGSQLMYLVRSRLWR